MLRDSIFKMLIAGTIGFFTKIIYDWIVSGRFEKGVYVKIKDCIYNRDKCCITSIKKQAIEHEMKIKAAEEKLIEGKEDFHQIKKDLIEIKECLAGLKIMFQSFKEGKR